MRKMFIVLGKLLGLVVLYWTLLALLRLGLAVQSWLSADYGGSWRISWVVAPAVYFALSLILALLLMFKTEKLADSLRLKGDEEPGKATSTHDMFVTGSALIGLYLLVAAIPSLVRALIQSGEYPGQWRGSDLLGELIAGALRLVLGLVLLLAPKTVARAIKNGIRLRQKSTPPDETTP